MEQYLVASAQYPVKTIRPTGSSVFLDTGDWH